jgi:hypothetical protein
MKYQIVCPNCHHEWHYDQGYYDDEIARLGVEIQDIMTQLHAHNQLPEYMQRQRTEWWLSAKKALTMKQTKLSELRALRKMYNEQRRKSIDEYFKQIVKEQVGEVNYVKWMEQADKEAGAYTIKDIMKTPYSRANYKEGVTSIDKLKP